MGTFASFDAITIDALAIKIENGLKNALLIENTDDGPHVDWAFGLNVLENEDGSVILHLNLDDIEYVEKVSTVMRDNLDITDPDLDGLSRKLAAEALACWEDGWTEVENPFNHGEWISKQFLAEREFEAA